RHLPDRDRPPRSPGSLQRHVEIEPCLAVHRRRLEVALSEPGRGVAIIDPIPARADIKGEALARREVPAKPEIERSQGQALADAGVEIGHLQVFASAEEQRLVAELEL